MADLEHNAKKRKDHIHDLNPPGCYTAKCYRGEQLTDGTYEVTIELSTFFRENRVPMATTFHPLPLCLHIRNHSPTGFAWGYAGSGPAQLALALLMDAMCDIDLALPYYQEFKRSVVESWPGSWVITADEIRRFVASRQESPGAFTE